jgi:hypothetical protein
MGNWAINPSAFEPAPKDTDGISLFRRDFVTQEHLASVNRHRNGVRVAQISAVDCIKLHLSPQPSPDPSGPPGHSVIPEMPFVKRTAQTKTQARIINDLAQKLAQIASNNEVYTPPGLSDPMSKPKS